MNGWLRAGGVDILEGRAANKITLVSSPVRVEVVRQERHGEGQDLRAFLCCIKAKQKKSKDFPRWPR